MHRGAWRSFARILARMTRGAIGRIPDGDQPDGTTGEDPETRRSGRDKGRRATVDADVASRLARAIAGEFADAKPEPADPGAQRPSRRPTALTGASAVATLVLGLLVADTGTRDSDRNASHPAASAGSISRTPRGISPPFGGADLGGSQGPHSGAEEVNIRTAMTVAAVMSGNALATPPDGFVKHADSKHDFSAIQGQGGWHYRFDRGDGTAASDMAYFLAAGPNGRQWCVTPHFGGTSSSSDTSHCTLTADWSHTNTAEICNTPAQGTLRPIREWTGQRTTRRAVHLTLAPSALSGGMRFDLLADGVVVWSRTWSHGNNPPADELIDIAAARSIALRCDPLGTCASDGAWQSIEIYSPDCDRDGLADDAEIAAGAIDVDGNGIPDACECAASPGLPPCCPTDLNDDGQVNGADLGALVAFWGPNPSYPRADITGDGTVNGSDLGLLLAAWGACPP